MNILTRKDKKKVVFFTKDGREAKNSVYCREINGELIFYELLGMTGVKAHNLINVPKASVNKKEKYKRLFIQRVYPHISVED